MGVCSGLGMGRVSGRDSSTGMGMGMGVGVGMNMGMGLFMGMGMVMVSSGANSNGETLVHSTTKMESIGRNNRCAQVL